MCLSDRYTNESPVSPDFLDRFAHAGKEPQNRRSKVSNNPLNHFYLPLYISVRQQRRSTKSGTAADSNSSLDSLCPLPCRQATDGYSERRHSLSNVGMFNPWRQKTGNATRHKPDNALKKQLVRWNQMYLP